MATIVPTAEYRSRIREWHERVGAGEELVIAPVVLLPEVAAGVAGACRAGRLRTSTAHRVLRRWEQVSNDINLITVDSDLAGRAAGVAADRGVRGTDAVYLATATMLSRPVGLLSFDVRQRAGLRDEDGVVLLPADLDPSVGTGAGS